MKKLLLTLLFAAPCFAEDSIFKDISPEMRAALEAIARSNIAQERAIAGRSLFNDNYDPRHYAPEWNVNTNPTLRIIENLNAENERRAIEYQYERSRIRR